MTGRSVTAAFFFLFFLNKFTADVWAIVKENTLLNTKRSSAIFSTGLEKLVTYINSFLHKLYSQWPVKRLSLHYSRHQKIQYICDVMSAAGTGSIFIYLKWHLVSYHGKFTFSDDMKTNGFANIIHSYLFSSHRDYSCTSTILWLYRDGGRRGRHLKCL